MDQKLRDEFRAYKVETDDRIKRLEAAVKALTASKDDAEGNAAQKAAPKPTASSEAKS